MGHKQMSVEELKRAIYKFILTKENKDQLVDGLFKEAQLHGWKLKVLDDIKFFVENQVKYPTTIVDMLDKMTIKFGERYFSTCQRRQVIQLMVDMALFPCSGNIFKDLGKPGKKPVPKKTRKNERATTLKSKSENNFASP